MRLGCERAASWQLQTVQTSGGSEGAQGRLVSWQLRTGAPSCGPYQAYDVYETFEGLPKALAHCGAGERG